MSERDPTGAAGRSLLARIPHPSKVLLFNPRGILRRLTVEFRGD